MLLNHLKSSGTWMYANGILPIDLQTPTNLLHEYVEEQARKIIANIEELSQPTAFRLSEVASVQIFLCNFQKFYPRVNVLYPSLFEKFNSPSISCVGVDGLPRGALISMNFVFLKNA